MAERGLYERVLARIGEGVELPRSRVKASASVVPWRRRADRLEVYWVRRSPELAFMGGWHAFPGGGRSRADAALALNGEPAGVAESPPAAAMPATLLHGVELEPLMARGIVTAALRELFEETGILPAAGEPEWATLEEARARLLGGAASFAEILSELHLEPAIDRLTCAGRWLTPPLGPVRFDNRFFLLEWDAGEVLQPSVRPGELVSGEWIDPGEALARWRRGEVIAAPPILHILRVLSEEGLPRGLERLREPVEANLGPFRRIEFRPGVLLFPLPTPTLPPAAHTNAYVVGRERAVLVDPGSPHEEVIQDLVAALRELEREAIRVIAVWLTHHHPDHVGGVETIRRELGLPVCAHRATIEHLAASGIRVDRELHDGERIVLGPDSREALRVVHTPGHARGHLVFLDEVGGSLLAGDLVAGVGTIVIDPPEGDMEDYLQSLEKAAGLGATTLFPAHGPTIWQADAKLAEYRRHRLWREERIATAWLAGCRDTEELLDRVYDDIQPIARPLAARQLAAHLARLRTAGRLT